jgi:hypothetical protein
MIPCGGCNRGAPYDSPYDMDRQCRLCWLYANDADYRALWDGTAVETLEAKIRLQPRDRDCIHLGGATGQLIECPSCQGNVRVKLFACALHGTTSLRKAVVGHTCCLICPDYLARESENP